VWCVRSTGPMNYITISLSPSGCNSNCLMCSQPPKDRDDVVALTERNLELIRLIEPAPPYLTITGGEPTLLGDNLFHAHCATETVDAGYGTPCAHEW